MVDAPDKSNSIEGFRMTSFLILSGKADNDFERSGLQPISGAGKE